MSSIWIKCRNCNKVLDLPCEPSEMQTVLDEIKEEQGLLSQVFVEKVISPADLWRIGNRYVSLEELNILAMQMERFNQSERAKFYAIIGYEQTTDVAAMISLTFNLRTYTLIQDVSSMESVGKTYVHTINDSISDEEMEKVDFAMIGKKLISEGSPIPTIYGLLFRNAVKVQKANISV